MHCAFLISLLRSGCLPLASGLAQKPLKTPASCLPRFLPLSLSFLLMAMNIAPFFMSLLLFSGASFHTQLLSSDVLTNSFDVFASPGV